MDKRGPGDANVSRLASLHQHKRTTSWIDHSIKKLVGCIGRHPLLDSRIATAFHNNFLGDRRQSPFAAVLVDHPLERSLFLCGSSLHRSVATSAERVHTKETNPVQPACFSVGAAQSSRSCCTLMRSVCRYPICNKRKTTTERMREEHLADQTTRRLDRWRFTWLARFRRHVRGSTTRLTRQRGHCISTSPLESMDGRCLISVIGRSSPNGFHFHKQSKHQRIHSVQTMKG
jgi:hypothetical protein